MAVPGSYLQNNFCRPLYLFNLLNLANWKHFLEQCWFLTRLHPKYKISWLQHKVSDPNSSKWVQPRQKSTFLKDPGTAMPCYNSKYRYYGYSVQNFWQIIMCQCKSNFVVCIVPWQSMSISMLENAYVGHNIDFSTWPEIFLQGFPHLCIGVRSIYSLFGHLIFKSNLQEYNIQIL